MFIETFWEFAQRQGCPYVRRQHLFVFENGAQSTGDQHADPSPDEFERLRVQRVYVAAKLKVEQDEFADFKQYVQQQSAWAAKYSNLPGPPTTAPRDLAAGAKRIEALEARLAEIDARLAESPEARHVRELEAARVAERQRYAAIAAECNNF